MTRRTNRTLTLEEVGTRFENWRQSRQGKASIPDELWSAAVEIARKEGLNRTSTRLHVEWNQLKAAHGDGRASLAAAGAADVCGTDSSRCGEPAGLHD
jgi:hypothetical protein